MLPSTDGGAETARKNRSKVALDREQSEDAWAVGKKRKFTTSMVTKRKAGEI